MAERSQHFDHVIAVIDSVDEVLLLLLLNRLGQLRNLLFQHFKLIILSLSLSIELLLLRQVVLFEPFLVFLFGLQLFKLSLASAGLPEFTLCSMLLLLSLNLQLSLLDGYKLIVGVFDLSLDQSDLLFAVIHRVHLIRQFY